MERWIGFWFRHKTAGLIVGFLKELCGIRHKQALGEADPIRRLDLRREADQFDQEAEDLKAMMRGEPRERDE